MPANNMNEIDPETIEFYVKEIYKELKNVGYDVSEEFGIATKFITNIPNENEGEYKDEIYFSFEDSFLENLIKRAFEAGKSKVVIPGHSKTKIYRRQYDWDYPNYCLLLDAEYESNVNLKIKLKTHRIDLSLKL